MSMRSRGAVPLLVGTALIGSYVAALPAHSAPGAGAAVAGADARFSLRGTSTRDRIYFVMTDRFANGSRANDHGGLSGGPLQTGLDPTNKGFYHGGDLKGLTVKLDYLKGLGTNAIWLTPPYENRPVQGVAPFISAGYHGYWIEDFTRIDPHLGTAADMHALIRAAHARGIKIYFDIVANHTADVIGYREGVYSYRNKTAYPYRDANGHPFDDRAYADRPSFPPLDVATSFPYTPVFRTPADAGVKAPAWLNDRTMYHNRGDSTFAGESSQYGDFFGLDDLFTERPEVLRGMISIFQRWIRAYGIDGYRVDTVKHVNTEFWQRLVPAVLHFARSHGKPRFSFFGEVADSDPTFTSTYTTTAGLPAVLDFGFQASARAFASQSAPATNLRDFFRTDDLYTDADSNAYQLPTFLDNHDMGRIGLFIRQDNPAAPEAEVLARDRLAHDVLYLSRGNPIVYYGDEQGFVGDGGDQDARQDMFPSRVASYNDDDLIGTDQTTADANFDRGHPLYRHIAGLAALTATHPALRDGAQIERYASPGAGILAFSRIDARQQLEYVVALNNSTTAQAARIPTYSAGLRFGGLYPAGLAAATSGTDARLTVTVPPLSAVVYRASARLAPSHSAAVRLTSPAGNGQVVAGRALVSAAAPGGGFAQVSFAVRVDGSSQWRLLGTDDNPDYRVFFDTSGLRPGTRLTLRAVARDNAGHLAADTVAATVGG